MKDILIITGGSRGGIGKALLEKYNQEGFDVVSISRGKIEKLTA